MSKFGLTSSQISTTVNNLTSDNSEFKARVAELLELQQELAAEWTGDANTAFNNAFNNDKGQWDTFASLIDQYIQAMQSILQTYEQAESTNVGTAQTRTY